MSDGWSHGEKKLARRVFEEALGAELSEVMAEFRARAASIAEPDDMWQLEDYLREKRIGIERKYDYRYSQLIWVFGNLLREGRIQEAQLTGLSEEKLDSIRRIATF
ncbi:hypothetical protein [Ramlibacter sp. WS9]|uniref:hypothetical protein n=1 Tax=Ramlibacter sp. WS9 TaxID=1882741 RepID=UPI0011413603|nr:hypothetical protein [Ramlibacter sp. WS9]ROZ75375.1 hypothetical protein EEB15_15570 [Ramlibacter sp. WS9]